MLSAKVHAPYLLPPKSLTQTQFNIWAAKLHAWLAADDHNAQFLPSRMYGEWQSGEQNPHRIAVLAAGDSDLAAEPTAQ